MKLRSLLTGIAIVVVVASSLVLAYLFLQDGEENEPGLSTPEFRQASSRSGSDSGSARVQPIKGVPLERGMTEGPSTDCRRAFPDPLAGPREMTFAGQVRDADSKPVPDAAITVYENVSRRLNNPLAGHQVAATRTDSRGYFACTAIVGLGSTFILRVRHQEYPQRWVLRVDPLRPASMNQDILLGWGQRVPGRVRTVDGMPVAGAKITLSDPSTPTRNPALKIERFLVTDADGRFELNAVSQGRKRLVVRAQGFCLAFRDPLRIRGRHEMRTLEFTLGPGNRIAGRVVEEGSERGIPDARVTLRAVSRSGRATVYAGDRVTSNGDGTFLVEGVPHGTYVVSATADGYASSSAVNARPGQEDLLFSLRPMATVSGRVIDVSGHPVAHCAVVAALTPDPSAAPWNAQTRVADASGAFRLPSAPVGAIYLFARAPGYGGGRVGPLQVERGQVLADVELIVHKGAVVTGRVVDDQGQPMAGVRVTLLRNIVLPKRRNSEHHVIERIPGQLRAPMLEVETWPDGTFLAVALDSGSYLVTVDAGDDWATQSSETVDVTMGGETPIPDIQLERSAGIEGIVLDRQGLPDANATVSVTSAAGGTRRTVATNEAGRFRITGLPPGTFKILVVQRKGKVDVAMLVRGPGSPGTTVNLARGVVESVELREGK